MWRSDLSQKYCNDKLYSWWKVFNGPLIPLHLAL